MSDDKKIRRAIVIGKGDYLSKFAVVFENGNFVLWSNITENIDQLFKIIDGVQIYSRSWETNLIKKMTNRDLTCIYIKDYFEQLTNLKSEKLTRFDMAKICGITVKGFQVGDPVATAKTYWQIFKKLEKIKI